MVPALLCALALLADPDDDNAPDTSEREAVVEAAPDAGFLYTAELTDEELERRFVEDLPSLGSISVGLAEAGRVINSVQLQPSAHLEVVTPENAWATEETA